MVESSVRLALGKRDNDQGISGIVRVDDGVGEAVVDVVERAAHHVEALRRVPFSSEGAPGAEEVAVISFDEFDDALGVPSSPTLSQVVGTLEQGNDTLALEQIESTSWSFYAVRVADPAASPAYAVRSMSPMRGLRRGSKITGLFKSDVLQTLDGQVLALDLDVDLLVRNEEVFVLNRTGMLSAFSDPATIREHAGLAVAGVISALNIGVGESSSTLLRELCSTRARLARRVLDVANCGYLGNIDGASFTEALTDWGMAPDRFGSTDEVRLETLDDVLLFLDVVEDRPYVPKFGGDARRADRFSPLKPS